MRIAAIATHPIQYQAPWFRALAASGLDLVVLFGCLPGAAAQGTGFGVPFEWDVPMTDGYVWETLELRRPARLDRFLGLRARGLRRRMALGGYEAVLSTGWNSWILVQALRAARSLRLPVVVRAESNDRRRRPAWKRSLHRAFLRSFAAFLVIGEANRGFYRASGVPGHRLFTAPYFVDNRAFADAAGRWRARRAELRARWGVAPEAACALFAGKLAPKKRPGDLLEALEHLGSEPLRRHLLVAGDGALRPELERRARERSLPVTFTGFLNQTEIPEAYAAADFLVLPSDSGETWGLVVNEAMASGLPALVSDQVGCAPDLVLPGETGAIHRCGDAGDLARAWRAMESDPAELARLGERARAHVFATHSVEQAVEGTLAALRYVVERR